MHKISVGLTLTSLAVLLGWWLGNSPTKMFSPTSPVNIEKDGKPIPPPPPHHMRRDFPTPVIWVKILVLPLTLSNGGSIFWRWGERHGQHRAGRLAWAYSLINFFRGRRTVGETLFWECSTMPLVHHCMAKSGFRGGHSPWDLQIILLSKLCLVWLGPLTSRIGPWYLITANFQKRGKN